MSFAHRRQTISDHTWHLLEPPLPGRAGRWGDLANDIRPLIHAVFWVLRIGAPWRDVPPDDGQERYNVRPRLYGYGCHSRLICRDQAQASSQ